MGRFCVLDDCPIARQVVSEDKESPCRRDRARKFIRSFTRVPQYQIKMWKSEGSELPVPGSSEPKQEFYQQPLFPNGTDQPNPLRLAVLWNIDWQKNLAAVWLVCPKSGDEKSA